MDLRDCQQAAIKCFQDRQAAGEDQTNLSLCTGAGKSLIIEHITSNVGGRVIIVFPWLLLMQQYFDKHKNAYTKGKCMYFATEGTLRGIQKLSDDMRELATPEYIIFTTYTSAPQIYARIGAKRRVDLICHDEAHRTQRPQYRTAFDLIVGHVRHVANLSATLPQEAHYKYSLLRGIKDGVVRDFHMELLMCSSRERNDTNLIVKIVEKLKVQHKQVKLLVYTSEANTDGPDSSSVKTFMDTHAQTLRGLGWWIEGINADTEADSRTALFRAFEQHRDVSILVSCKTLSEGIDLLGSNCVLPWDPSNSIIDNIQRIGRVLRLYKTKDGKIAKHQPASSILIPVFLEESKYLACEGDREKVSEMLAGEIGEAERGNFRAIVNVCTALKSELAEEDEELYNRLLNYPNETTVSVDMSLIECVAKKCKRDAEEVLEDVASKLEEKGLEADDVRDGAWDEDMNDDVAHALADTLGITLTVSDGDEANTFGNGPVSVNVKKEEDNYVIVRGKKDVDAAAKRQIAQRISYDFSDGCKILLGLETVETADTMGGMVLTRLTVEVQVDENWDKRLEECVQMYEKLGRYPSKRTEDTNEKSVGIWINNQRSYYKRKTLSQERIEKLEQLSWWKWKKDDTWEQQLKIWIQQYQKLGRNPSKKSQNIDEKHAGQWQSDQRKHYNRGTLSQERIEKLEKLVWWKWEKDETWEPQRQNWMQEFQRLGKNPSIMSQNQNEKCAAQWQGNQRNKYRKGVMSEKRIELLNDTPGWKWEEDENRWELQRQNWIHQTHILGRTPLHHATNQNEKSAAQWQSQQRKAFRKKESWLTQERINALNNIPEWKWKEENTWELQRQNWIEQYEILGENPKQTSTNKDELCAARWQHVQRKKYKDGKLAAAQIIALNDTPNWEWEEDVWEPNRQNWIKQYHKYGRNPLNKTTDPEEKRAANWQSNQRKGYRNKDSWMTPKRIEILNNTPGWSWTGRGTPSKRKAITAPTVPKALKTPAPPSEPKAPTAPRVRKPIKALTKPPTGRPHVPSQLEQFHKRFKSMNASTYKSTITAAEFAEYHAIADTYDARDPPERQPLNKIAAMLSKSNKPTYSAIDLGCGKNRLRAHPQVSRMNWTSLDVHAADDTVTVADMAALPYDDETYDIAVLSRSLWARNHMDVLTETFRILKSGGRAIICESFRRWQEAAAGAGSDTLINGLLRDLALVGFEIIQQEGTSVDDAVDDVFQYIIVRKP